MKLTRRTLLSRAVGATAAVSSAARAAEAVTARGRPGSARAAARRVPGWIEADLPAVERILGLSYSRAERRQLARGYQPVLKELARVRSLNATGHPCFVLKAGFLERPTRAIDDAPIHAHGAEHRVPRAICLWSPLFREDVLITLGRALEAVLGVADLNPPLALR